MDVREKLVELLAGCPCESDCEGMVGSCPHRKNGNCNEIFKLSYCAVSKLAQHLIAHGVTVQVWISVDDRLPKNFVSVLGYMTDAGEFPPVRECYTVGNAFFFPALGDVHPVSHWCELPQPPKGE